MWNGKDLLEITARDIGDYGRQVMSKLFTPDELQRSILPSQSAHLYNKDVLDEQRFNILNGKWKLYIMVNKIYAIRNYFLL